MSSSNSTDQVSLFEALEAVEIVIADDLAVNWTQPPHNEYTNVVAFNTSDIVSLNIKR